MILKNIGFIFSILLCIGSYCYSQNSYNVENKKGIDKIDFKLVNNVVIFPIEVNGVELSFLLDSGVNKPIVFNFLKASDSLEILNAEKIYLKGLGNEGVIEALKSSNNTFKIGDAINRNQDFYVVFDSSINFAPLLGVPIHGIIGYDVFKDLVVDINYSKKQLKLYNQEDYKSKKCKKCETFNLDFYNNKPYINIETKINNNSIPVKLLIDTGSSDSLWLFKDDSLGITNSNTHFEDFLGFGLTGSIHGKRSKIESVNLNSFEFENPKVAFPDEEYLNLVRKISGRNGSIGGEILKRFNIIFNYNKAKVILKKNQFYKNEFSYNKAGVTLINEGVRLVTEFDKTFESFSNSNQSKTISVKAVYTTKARLKVKPAFVISQIREDSPAAIAGLQIGDVVISINNTDTKNYTLQKLTSKFFGTEGKNIKLKVDRNGKLLSFSFRLKSPLN